MQISYNHPLLKLLRFSDIYTPNRIDTCWIVTNTVCALIKILVASLLALAAGYYLCQGLVLTVIAIWHGQMPLVMIAPWGLDPLQALGVASTYLVIVTFVLGMTALLAGALLMYIWESLSKSRSSKPSVLLETIKAKRNKYCAEIEITYD